MRKHNRRKNGRRIPKVAVEAMERRTMFSALSGLTLDPGFGTGGKVSSANAPGGSGALTAVNPVNGDVYVIGNPFSQGSQLSNSYSVQEFTRTGATVSSFGSNGRTTVTQGGELITAAVQSDGKLLVESENLQVTQLYLTRFTTSGAIDTTFGTAGTYSFPIVSSSLPGGFSFAVLPNGNIAIPHARVSGSVVTSEVTMLTSNGKLDTSFGSNGTATGINGNAVAVATDTSGNLIVAGTVIDTAVSSGFAAMLERFTPSGKLDTAWGNGGSIITTSASDFYSVIVDSAGILTNGDTGVERFTFSGQPDTSFGGGTGAASSINLSADEVQELIGGKILVSGLFLTGSNAYLPGLARLNADGSLDTSFGTGGYVDLNNSGFPNVAAYTQNGISVATDGDIFLPNQNSPGLDFNPVALTANGSADRSFGFNGVAAGRPLFATGNALTRLSNGQFLVAGDVTLGNSTGLFIQRYNADGAVDSSFAPGKGYDGVNGYIFIGPFLEPSGVASPSATGLAIDSSGRIDLFAAGIGMLRFNADGTLDKIFGVNGVAPNVTAGGFLLEPNGQILLASGTSTLTRFNSNGQTDKTFGSGGTVTFPDGFDQSDGVLAVASNSEILVGGQMNEASANGQVLAVLKLQANGAVDTSFGSAGIAVADQLAEEQQGDRSSYNSQTDAITLLASGTIVLEGAAGIEGPAFRDIGPTVAEFLPNGSLNTAFGSGGQTIHFTGGGSYFNPGDATASLLAQPDGSLIVATTLPTGEPSPGLPSGGLLIHYTANGAVNDFTSDTATQAANTYPRPVVQAVAGPTGTVLVLSSEDGSQDQGPFLSRYLTAATGTVSGTVYNDFTGNAANFKTPAAGQIIYADLNNNGRLDPGEPFTKTNSAGQFTLTGIPVGAQIVRDELPANERQSFPAGGSGEHVTVGLSPVTGVNFSVTTDIYLSGMVTEPAGAGPVTVYVDRNNDGKQESNEPSVQTNSQGGFFFDSLTAGTYTIRIVPPAGYVQSDPANNAGITLTLGSGGVNTHLSFTLIKASASAGSILGVSESYLQGDINGGDIDGSLPVFGA